MSAPSENIFGNRLKLARKMAGLSLQELADKLTSKVTKQALNKYEMGQMKPTNEVLLAIAKVLQLPPEYFLKELKVDIGQISFRKKKSLTKKEEDSIVEMARDYLERYSEIEAILASDIPFENPIASYTVTNKADVERAANRLRQIWQLGDDPIPNLIEMLELKGVRILLIDASDDIDGFAAFSTNLMPLVVVNRKDRSLERIRFTIIHELAHILLNFGDEHQLAEKEIEVLCHCFSSCFLIPSTMLVQMVGGKKRSYIDLKELVAIKEYYGISIRALLHRLRELNIIIPNYYQRWVIYLSKQYGSKEEPGKYIGIESPKIFDLMISRALSEDLISISKAAALTRTSVSEIRKGLTGAH